MRVATIARRLGNELYRSAFPVYRPLYSAFKWYADRAERRLLARILRPGDVVVDAGANIGVYSRYLQKCVGPTGMVHSFEPSPENFARLQTTVGNLPNVRVNQLAISNTTGESVLYISNDLNVDHRLYPDGLGNRQRVSVHAVMLDDYFEPGARIDLIKMDIQGFELHALQGASRILDENPAINLLLEFWPYGLQRAGADSAKFIAFLQTRGFALWANEANNIVPYNAQYPDPSEPSEYLNLFAQRSR